MKIFLRSQQKRFESLLEDLMRRPIADTTGVLLRTQISEIGGLPDRTLNDADYSILFEYRIFPPAIMSYLTQWSIEGRSMRVGDTILQQVYVPPFPLFSQKIIFGVRIDGVIDEPGRRGFSYATLEGHAEKGRSVFTFEQPGGKKIFRIKTFSAPGNLLSKLSGPFFARPYQAYCTQKALEYVKNQLI
jgi:hypothetical protein